MVEDDLIFHVPIYDMLDRRYAAFSSLPEAVKKLENDPKGNGKRFLASKDISDHDFITKLYLFRLCGSGINYIPGDHGFGNFWVVKDLEAGETDRFAWLDSLPESRFSDCKGYLLPMFSIGLRNFILEYAYQLVDEIYEFCLMHRRSIKEVVDFGNGHLIQRGFKRQTFVLSAFAADLAEYYSDLVDPWSMIYAGTNAKKCIKAIFGPRAKEEKCIQFLADRYEAPPYSVEDSRLCDPVRYFCDFQSQYHIEANKGNVYQNNSLLKKKWTKQEYQDFVSQLRT